MLFKDRRAAGQILAEQLAIYTDRPDVLVLALPRGGVPVGYEIATALNAPLDIFLVRKLGVPGQEELAMGAIASGGVRVLNSQIVRSLELSESAIDRVSEKERQELQRRECLYRDRSPAREVGGCTIILVDDGLATGATMRAAIRGLRQQQPAKIVVAVPVSSAEIKTELQAEVEDIVCTSTPHPFYSVGMWYEDFSQTTDEEVRDFLALSASNEPMLATPAS